MPPPLHPGAASRKKKRMGKREGRGTQTHEELGRRKGNKSEERDTASWRRKGRKRETKRRQK